MSSIVGAHSTKTARGGGSSMARNRALPACSVSRSASSTMTTRQRPRSGASETLRTSCRASATPYDRPSGATTVTSGWVPARTVWQSSHWPQPPLGHCSAAANARAATERPEPGGPVSNHACVMLAGPPPLRIVAASAAAWARTATACSWPTASAKTAGNVGGAVMVIVLARVGRFRHSCRC